MDPYTIVAPVTAYPNHNVLKKLNNVRQLPLRSKVYIEKDGYRSKRVLVGLYHTL